MMNLVGQQKATTMGLQSPLPVNEEDDHIHLPVGHPPHVLLSKLVYALKGPLSKTLKNHRQKSNKNQVETTDCEHQAISHFNVAGFFYLLLARI